jgi:hypothetical protein
MKKGFVSSFVLIFTLGALALSCSSTSAFAQVIADSIAEFSGTQGQNGWSNGYRNYTKTGETESYDPVKDFIAYTGGAGQGAWDGIKQQWTGSQWDLNTANLGPWTFQNATTIHPNGANSAPNEEHWAIRRWAATELTGDTAVEIGWHVRKTSANGNGVTAGIWINGKKLEEIAIEGVDTVGVTTTNTVTLKRTDIVDLIVTPAGPDGLRGDGSDGSVTWMKITFPIVDTDSDGFLDRYETNSGHDPKDPNNNPTVSAIAKSNEQFSGVQGQDDWFHGYRNVTADKQGNKDYDPQTGFVRFTDDVFTGSQWDLNTAAAAPWTELGRENTHPNGSNSSGGVHWTVRRWVASKVTKVTAFALHWHTRKTNVNGTGGNGVTGALHINGKEVDKAVLVGTDGTGVTRAYYANISPGDIVDLVLKPTGTDGSDSDGQDGSANWLLVDPVLPSNPVQPDGTVFIPAGAGDTDGDGIPDAWEKIFFPNDLTKLLRTGDFDKDGLNDLAEYQRDSDPTKTDTDGDGLSDLVETGTAKFVSVNDTGSSAKKTDTDGDGRSDRDEVLGTPTTDPNKTDTDGDGFSDSEEISAGSNPNDKNDNVLAFVIANSIAEFSGVQGTNGWFNGFRNFTTDGGETNYNAQTAFIPYKGGVGQGAWDGDTQQWTGSAWNMNTGGNGPWTSQGPQDIHPNGENSFPFEEHWAIRRWVATELTKATPVGIIWQVRKSNLNGDGVTGSIFVNGKLVDSMTIGGGNGTNPTRRFYVVLSPNDVVDLALTPQGLTTRADGADGSVTWFWIDTRIPANAKQPDGTPFNPGGGGAGVKLESTVLDAVQKRITFAWTSVADAKYTIEASDDLKTWTVVRADLPSGGTRTTFSDTVDPSKRGRFYRIRQ